MKINHDRTTLIKEVAFPHSSWLFNNKKLLSHAKRPQRTQFSLHRQKAFRGLGQAETTSTYVKRLEKSHFISVSQPEMTVSVNSGTVKLAFPIDYEAEVSVSQRLLEASHHDDLKSAFECIANTFVDVNFIGTVNLKTKKTEIVLHEESAHEVRVEYEEFKTDVTALFLAAHSGNLTLVRKLLVKAFDRVFIYLFFKLIN